MAEQRESKEAARVLRAAKGGLAIDSEVPHPARMYDYVLGGETYFPADRELADEMASALPGGLDFAQALARRNRAFMARVVRHLAAEAGIRQFLDIGAGIPAFDNTHEVAQAVDPTSRVVYVDHDPIVLAHAHQRLGSSPEGACDYIHADLRNADEIVERAAETLDLDEPIGLLLVAILHLVDDDSDPYGAVARLVEALPRGSLLAVSHFTADVVSDEMREMADIYTRAGAPMAMRSHAEVDRFFDGLEPVAPGVVLIEDWRPSGDRCPADAQPIPLYGGVAIRR